MLLELLEIVIYESFAILCTPIVLDRHINAEALTGPLTIDLVYVGAPHFFRVRPVPNSLDSFVYCSNAVVKGRASHELFVGL